MKIDLFASKMEMTGAITTYVEKKMGKLEKFLKRFPEGSYSIKTEVGKTTDHHEKGKIFFAEGSVTVPQRQFYAKSQEEDLYAAIDKMTDELKRQIVDDKEKQLAHRRA